MHSLLIVPERIHRFRKNTSPRLGLRAKVSGPPDYLRYLTGSRGDRPGVRRSVEDDRVVECRRIEKHRHG